MASVFLSYARDDAAKAQGVAAALEKAGHSVWWDRRIRGGSEFSEEIEEALNGSDHVVVLWSAHSVKSAWVRDEAGAGRDRGCLIPVLIEPVQPPMGFRQYQTIDLTGRSESRRKRGLEALAAAIAPRSGEAATARAVPASSRVLPQPSPKLVAGAAAMAVLAAAAGGYWFLSGGAAGAPTVALAAADKSARSQAMARDLLVKFGNLQGVKAGSLTLVGENSADRPADLVFQAADTSTPATRSASLVLLGRKTGGLLWSSDFEQPSGSASDLSQQVAYTGGAVLQCALEGLSEQGVRLDPQVLKAYLNACARLSDISSSDPRPVIPVLRQVTQEVPRFRPAWGRLLLAQSAISDLLFTNGVPDRPAQAELRHEIVHARKLHPGIVEADLAETVLLAPRDYAQKLALIDRASRQSPNDPNVLSARANALMSVGRMADAVDAARLATETDQLSPALSALYMVTLAYAGLVDPARQQLLKLERLWPGTATEQAARWLFYFRFGDPRVALGMEESKTSTAGVRYLVEARLNPSRENVDRLVTFLRARKDKLREDAGASRLAYYTLAMGTFHQHDELFDTLIHWAKPSDMPLVDNAYFRPELHDFRKEPRFLQIMKRAGLLDYWRKSGQWPDFCFDADLPYDCKAEAAKLG